jgi:hypothetical protein
MEPIYMASVLDSNLRVPLVAVGVLGDDDHDRRFAEVLLQGASPAFAAEMVDELLKDYVYELASWKVDLIRACISKGGDLGRAMIVYRQFTTPNCTQTLNLIPSSSPESESAAVRLAWIWAYASSGGRQPALHIRDLVNLIESLREPHRECALCYLSVQANFLSIELRQYLEEIEAVGGADAEAVREGKEERQPADGVHKTWGFPALHLGDQLN